MRAFFYPLEAFSALTLFPLIKFLWSSHTVCDVGIVSSHTIDHSIPGASEKEVLVLTCKALDIFSFYDWRCDRNILLTFFLLNNSHIAKFHMLIRHKCKNMRMRERRKEEHSRKCKNWIYLFINWFIDGWIRISH